MIGATDTRASEAYNQKLSERRANNVKDYLIQNGVQSDKLNAVGRGEKILNILNVIQLQNALNGKTEPTEGFILRLNNIYIL